MRAKQYGESLLLLLDVIDILDNLNIPYMTIGAIAVSIYGPPRASLDADAVIQIEPDEVKKLSQELEKKRITVEIRKGDKDDPIRLVFKSSDKYGNRVDLLSGIKGMRDDAFQRAEKVRFKKDVLRVIGMEDLIAMKVAAGGPQDIEDVNGILKLMGKRVNKKLLNSIAGGYGKRIQKRINSLLPT